MAKPIHFVIPPGVNYRDVCMLCNAYLYCKPCHIRLCEKAFKRYLYYERRGYAESDFDREFGLSYDPLAIKVSSVKRAENRDKIVKESEDEEVFV